MNDLAKYIEIMLTSQFPQSNLLTSSNFLKYLQSMNFKIKKDDLEYYDKKGILKPALRLNRRELNDGFQKYETVIDDIFTMQLYFKNGDIQLVKDDYQQWEDYKDGPDEKVFLYYHPFQFLPLRRLTEGTTFSLGGSFFENEDIMKFFNIMKDSIINSLESSKKSYEEYWIPRLGLLILLDEAYGPLVKNFKVNFNKERNMYYNEWLEWREKKFKPNQILEICNLSIEDIRKFYEGVATDGQWLDPLSDWFVLQRIFKRSILLKLKHDAFHAQKCYEVSWILANFIYDLTGEKVYEPDDIMDGNGHGAWKNRIYGDPFDYTTKKTQKSILDIFLRDRPFRAGIIFEGETEQFVIEEILKAIRVDTERDGFFLYNAKGISNIGKNLNALYDLAKLEDISLFVILDNDNPEKTNKIKKDLEESFKRESIKIWERDFEYDNFEVDKMLNEINYTLKENKLKTIEKEKINQKLETGMSLMKSIYDVYYTDNDIDIFTIVSKTQLAQKLISPRIIEIEKENLSSEGWKPTLPIEKMLSEIFHTIPRISFSYPIY